MAGCHPTSASSGQHRAVAITSDPRSRGVQQGDRLPQRWGQITYAPEGERLTDNRPNKALGKPQ
jgi:hypothetical protein